MPGHLVYARVILQMRETFGPGNFDLAEFVVDVPVEGRFIQHGDTLTLTLNLGFSEAPSGWRVIDRDLITRLITPPAAPEPPPLLPALPARRITIDE